MKYDSKKDLPPYLEGAKVARMEDVEEFLKTGESDTVPDEVKSFVEELARIKKEAGEPLLFTKIPSSEEE